MKRLFVVSIFLCCAFSRVGAYRHTVINATPYDIQAKFNVIAGVDKTIQIPKNSTNSVNLGVYLIRGVTIDAINFGNRIENSILTEDYKTGVGGNITLYVLCEPVIERKGIPGGYSDVITKAKFYLIRMPRVGYPGGLVNKSKFYQLVGDE